MKRFDSRFRLAGAGLLLGAVLSATAWAMPPGFGGDLHGGPGSDLFHLERMAERLQLDDEQRGRLEALHERHREQARPYVRTLVKSRRAMKHLMKADTFDEAAVRAVAAEQSAAMTELAVIKARGRFEVREILTPEQRAKLRHRHRKGGRDAE